MAGESKKPLLEPDVHLVLRPLTYGAMSDVPLDARLKRLLKAALRSYGFRCVSVAKRTRWEMDRAAFEREAEAARKAG